MTIYHKCIILKNYMSNSYNTHDTELFPSTKVLAITGIVLQHRGKYFIYPFPFDHNKQEYAQYEIMISYFVIFERYYQFVNKMTSLCCRYRP